MKIRHCLGLLAAGLLLAACGEKPQTIGTRKADAKAWDIQPNGFVAPGWKPGDKATWEKQINQRAQAQNDYARAPATP